MPNLNQNLLAAVLTKPFRDRHLQGNLRASIAGITALLPARIRAGTYLDGAPVARRTVVRAYSHQHNAPQTSQPLKQSFSDTQQLLRIDWIVPCTC